MKVISILFLVYIFSAYNTNHEYLAHMETGDYSNNEIFQEHPGKKLLENNCYSCHGYNSSENKDAAPTMLAVKMHYMSENKTLEKFTKELLNWTNNPSEVNSKMPEAIEEFGLMPYQFYPESVIEKIAAYMWSPEFDE